MKYEDFLINISEDYPRFRRSSTAQEIGSSIFIFNAVI